MKGDFVKLVNKDMHECDLKFTYEEIQNIPKNKFKEIVKEAVEKASLRNLLKEKETLSKGKQLKYSELKTRPYLMPGRNLNITDMRRIFQMRI